MKSQKKVSKKIGRNPFESPNKSRVGRIIEGSFTAPSEKESFDQQLGILDRFQEMKVTVSLRDFLRARLRTVSEK